MFSASLGVRYALDLIVSPVALEDLKYGHGLAPGLAPADPPRGVPTCAAPQHDPQQPLSEPWLAPPMSAHTTSLEVRLGKRNKLPFLDRPLAVSIHATVPVESERHVRRDKN